MNKREDFFDKYMIITPLIIAILGTIGLFVITFGTIRISTG